MVLFSLCNLILRQYWLNCFLLFFFFSKWKTLWVIYMNVSAIVQVCICSGNEQRVESGRKINQTRGEEQISMFARVARLCSGAIFHLSYRKLHLFCLLTMFFFFFFFFFCLPSMNTVINPQLLVCYTHVIHISVYTGKHSQTCLNVCSLSLAHRHMRTHTLHKLAWCMWQSTHRLRPCIHARWSQDFRSCAQRSSDKGWRDGWIRGRMDKERETMYIWLE